ncbi:transcription-repair coupling factor [Moheibacter lacus]|uniref:Transcription-repair-coupling factor n=1 Tax=Moheibacter lacus TaxID=2745851 RepID=A0A838ZPG6_9FLAO|nr:transcription-repair coupling factor [Moheibacter lacus]MBA5628715.1 transcription-repair coupling factor [Moheibacter lacus]
METKTLHDVLKKYESSDFVQNTIAQFQKNTTSKIHVTGQVGSSISFLAAQIMQASGNPVLLILDDKEEAAYVLNELESLFSKDEVLFLPDSYRRPYEIEETNNANVVLRTEVLNSLNGAKKPRIVVTYAEGLFEKVVTRKVLSKNTLKVSVGNSLDIDFLNEVLFSYEFHRVDFVSEPGEFSIRGGIVDVFSFSEEKPYRISLFGDEIETIRVFDIETQLSVEKVKEFTIVPNLENKFTSDSRESFLDYIADKSIILAKNLNVIQSTIHRNFTLAGESFERLSKDIKHASPKELFLDEVEFKSGLQKFPVVEFSLTPYFDHSLEISLQQKPQPSFNKQFDLLAEELNQKTKEGFTNYLFCSGEKQVQRFHDIFEDIAKEVKFEPVIGSIHQGFVDEDLKITCFTDHQIFERYHKFNLRNSFAKKEAITLKELTSLQIGDYVTHIDHGVGKFAGLVKIDVQGSKQEAIKLFYRDNDILYVRIHSLHKIAKFTGKDGVEPKINKLGSPAWKNLKNKTKTKVKEIAFDLIKLYAKRRTQKGFQFTPDSYLQNELEASFIYEDTPDQLKATNDVKADMESERSMDRLVCGDVGFGKTEVAIRAAFKAATDGKQVAVLVPTTILAFQHFKTFTERLGDMPVTVAYLNRFKSAKQKKEILEKLAEGKIDIIIGTHQLVNKDVKYKDLGLLIVDEEHKFGVGVKDKLKTLRANIDTLTLTATPIPRTLQFSLMAARDLSIIKTPPPNRQPIQTQLIGFNEEQIRDAVFYELQRGGQVFFIHNRIDSLKEIAGMLQRLVPDAKIVTGHGQMKGDELEKVMLDFMDGRYDVLVSTTIVESGLDVPNANTILIGDAQNFGLADLHQMRGRVGRSNRKAFCYLISPPVSTLTNEARKRLQAIEQFSDLGSGFNISMKDLEIRGAGNLLGAEQSGFISDIGFDTYQKILNEAIEELKETDFKDLFEEKNIEEKNYVSEVQIDTDLQILIPDDYVNNVEERLALYNELAGIESKEKLAEFESNLVDRFGEYPKEVSNLLESMQLKWLAKDLGFERIVLKKSVMLAYFISKPQSDYFQTSKFQNIISTLHQNPRLATFKEKAAKNKEDENSLMLRFEEVKSVQKALEKLSVLKPEILTGVEN